MSFANPKRSIYMCNEINNDWVPDLDGVVVGFILLGVSSGERHSIKINVIVGKAR